MPSAAAQRFIEAVGRRIRELRLAGFLTQEQLAEKLGTATPHVQAIERGMRNFTLESLYRVATALSVEPIQLMVPPLTGSFETKAGRPTKAATQAARGRVPVVLSIAQPSDVGTRTSAKRSSRSRKR